MAAALRYRSSLGLTPPFVGKNVRRGQGTSSNVAVRRALFRSSIRAYQLVSLRSLPVGCLGQLRLCGQFPSKLAPLCNPWAVTSSLAHWLDPRQRPSSETERPSHLANPVRHNCWTQASSRSVELVADSEEDFVYNDEDDYKVVEASPASDANPPLTVPSEGRGLIGSLVLAAALLAVSFHPLPASAATRKADPPRSVATAPLNRPPFKQQDRRHMKSSSASQERQPEPPAGSGNSGPEFVTGPAPSKDDLDAAIRARVPYSWFLDAAENGLVKAVWIMNHWAFVLLEEGTVEYKPPEASWLEKMVQRDLGLERKPPANVVTVRLPDGDNVTVGALRNAGVRFEVVQGQPAWTEQLANAGQLMWYAMMGMLLFTMLGSGEMGGLPGMMNKKAKLFQGGKSDTNFQDVAGCDEAKEELVEVVDFLKSPEKYRALGARVPKGVLLCGPAGTGKTLLAKAVAGEADVPFFSISASEFVEIYGGMGASRVRKTFADCRKKAPCILFIDELDAIGRSRSMGQVGGYDQEREQTLNQMLTEMDGFDSTKDKPVIILGATNRPEILDTALLRPGRFDRTVTVDRPDKKGREEILRLHLKAIKIDKELDVSAIAGSTIGFTGADLANLVNEAALLAARKNLEEVGREQLMEAAERSRAGLERKSLKVSDEERRTVAFHECGHALVGAMSREVVRSTVTKISIVPRGSGALGYTLNEPREDRYLQGEDDIRSFIATALAGRAAERLVFGRLTSGASDDLQRATESAERMVTLFGMSSKVGPRALRTLRQSYLEEQGYAGSARQGGPQLQKTVDDEIDGILQAADDWCLRILVRNRALLNEMAEKLLVEEVLQESQLADFLKRAEAPEGLEDWFKTGSLPGGFHSDSIYREAPALALPG